MALEALGQDHPSTGSIDLVYERRSRWSYAGLEWAPVRRIPLILQVDASVFDEAPVLGDPVQEEAAGVIARRAVAAASTTIATSQGVADWVQSLGVLDIHLHVVPEGADPERFAALATGAPASPARGVALTIGILRRSLGLPASIARHGYAAFRDRHTCSHVLQTILDYSRPDTEGLPSPETFHLGSRQELWVETAP